ncbi:hypothetical protein BC830DRAFT_1166826 [Chytriomyces sp. MP71]|nr:hypothetical protein BC830DRAFT_1166826 [Chytriomyces sp. MP71]
MCNAACERLRREPLADQSSFKQRSECIKEAGNLSSASASDTQLAYVHCTRCTALRAQSSRSLFLSQTHRLPKFLHNHRLDSATQAPTPPVAPLMSSANCSGSLAPLRASTPPIRRRRKRSLWAPTPSRLAIADRLSFLAQASAQQRHRAVIFAHYARLGTGRRDVAPSPVIAAEPKPV